MRYFLGLFASVSQVGTALLDVDRAARELTACFVSAAGSAGNVEPLWVLAEALCRGLLNAHAETRVPSVVRARALELHRAAAGGNRGALVANPTEQCQVVDVDVGIVGIVGKRHDAIDAARSAGSSFCLDGELNLPLAVLRRERAMAIDGATRTRVVFRIRQFETDQSTLVPAGVPKAIFGVVSGI